METDKRNETIIKNVKIICVIIIIFSALGILSTISNFFGGFLNYNLDEGKWSSSISFKNVFDSVPQIVFEMIPSVLLNCALIYFAFGTYKMREKERSILSILIIIKIVFMVGGFVLIGMASGIINTFQLVNGGFRYTFVIVFFIAALVVAGISLTLFFMRRYLNKSETKTVFLLQQME